MKILTNKQPRLLLNYDDLPNEEREYFDYDGAQWHSFVKYRGEYYDIGDMMRYTGENWDAYQAHTVWSGVLVRLCTDDSDYVIMGYYTAV